MPGQRTLIDTDVDPPRAAARGGVVPIVPLGELVFGQEADMFVLLSAKEPLTTRDGKPYFKIAFRDAQREVSFPIWGDTAFAADCRDQWQVGKFYKLRATYRDTQYGPQLDLRRVREVTEADEKDGFSPQMCRPRSRYESAEMFADLMTIAREEIANASLRELVLDLLEKHHEQLLTLPAATHNHHAFTGGWLEHVLSVTRACVMLAKKYAAYYSDMQPPLDVGLVVAGGILHDIGKLVEIEETSTGAEYTSSGNLIGHILQGRDIVRDAARDQAVRGNPLEGDTLLRLEHIIVSHQRLPEWGSPKAPMTPEALLVHYADDIDAKFHMMATILKEDASPGAMTGKKNALYQRVYRGE